MHRAVLAEVSGWWDGWPGAGALPARHLTFAARRSRHRTGANIRALLPMLEERMRPELVAGPNLDSLRAFHS